MQTISLINAKGGVAKTVSSAAIISLLRKAGYRVLAIDLDPQANLTSVLGIEPNDDISEMLIRKNNEPGSYLVPTEYENVIAIPGGSSLSKVIYQLYEQSLQEDVDFRLKDILNTLSDRFDFVVIDNSPFESYLTRISLAASDLVLAPIELDNFSYDGLMILLEQIQELNRRSAKIKFKVFFTKVNSRTTLFKSLRGQYGEALGDTFTEAFIRNDNNVRESATVYKPLPEYAPTCNATEDYVDLIKEVLNLDKRAIKKIEASLKRRWR